MFNKLAMSVIVAAACAMPAAAHDFVRAPAPLPGAPVSPGTGAGSYSSRDFRLADVHVNALDGTVRANAAAGQNDVRSGRHASGVLAVGVTVVDDGVGQRRGR
jgi:hypothetical protein